MRRLLPWAVLALAGAALLAAGASGSHRLAYSIELTGTIDPATERWIDKALGEAAEKKAAVAIIRMDTPGGLDTSMRAMIKDIIAAPMPVIVYVYPDGARAASAGLYITQAGDVAAMAPQTNIGSATPISIGPGEQDEVLGRKIRNDAAAYVRALAEGHGRNPDLAEQMVRRAVNVTASEAKRADLIDVVASNEDELLQKLNGFQLKGPKAKRASEIVDAGGRLRTEGIAPIQRRDMPFQFEVLQLLVNPTVAFLLLAAGLAGLGFELFNPGMIAPGAMGVVSLILGLYGTSQLPVTAAGVILLIAALGLFLAEAQIASHGVLGGAGTLALGAGGLILFDTGSEAFDISTPVVITTAVLLGGFTVFVVKKALQARHGPVKTGWEELVGEIGEVRVPLDPTGQVLVQGALWRAQADPADGVLGTGYRVRVESVDGLTLRVRPVEDQPAAQPAAAKEDPT